MVYGLWFLDQETWTIPYGTSGKRFQSKYKIQLKSLNVLLRRSFLAMTQHHSTKVFKTLTLPA